MVSNCSRSRTVREIELTKNLWVKDAPVLAEAYADDASSVRFQIVTRALLSQLPPEPQRIVDIGGGFGRQAILLAREGHSVTVVDLDPVMLSMAETKLSREPKQVQSRVQLILGDEETAASSLDGEFDAACSHSVLMYLENPLPMIRNMVGLLRKGGLASVLCVNPLSSAMRSGLQGRWEDAVAILESGGDGSRNLSTYEHPREKISAMLESAGARTEWWHGIGVFTDHLTRPIVVPDTATVYQAEWLAGIRDPYRQVARCYHLIARRH
jgi:S-adenosylmethionine-dependent methyltransferase